MDGDLLNRAASVVAAATDYGKLTGMPVTSEKLARDISALYDTGDPGPMARAAGNFYRRFTEAIRPMCTQGSSLEDMLTFLLHQLPSILPPRSQGQNRWLGTYVMGTVACVKAAVDCVASRRAGSGALPSDADGEGSMAELFPILEAVRWNMTKNKFLDTFAHMEFLGPHPEQNAIAFGTTIARIPTVVVAYYQAKLFREKLGAVNIVVYQDPPPPDELRKAFEIVVRLFTDRYGPPTARQEELVAWPAHGGILATGTMTGLLGIRLGNPEIDPPSAMLVKR